MHFFIMVTLNRLLSRNNFLCFKIIFQDEEGWMEIDITGEGETWSHSFNVTGTFLGHTKIEARVEKIPSKSNDVVVHHASKTLDITVTRSKAKVCRILFQNYSLMS